MSEHALRFSTSMFSESEHFDIFIVDADEEGIDIEWVGTIPWDWILRRQAQFRITNPYMPKEATP